MSTELFNVIRGIKGSGLTKAEVDRVNRALAGGLAAAASAMKTSAKGIALIKSFESLALKAYPDPGSKEGKPWGDSTLLKEHLAGAPPRPRSSTASMTR